MYIYIYTSIPTQSAAKHKAGAHVYIRGNHLSNTT